MAQRQLDNCKNCNIKLDMINRAGRLNSCRDCYNKYKRRVNKENYHDHVGRVKQWHKDYHIQKTYGLTKLDYENKIVIQLNGCAICKLPFNDERKIGVDHDHATGMTRDLLCYRCNNILGLLNDDEDLIWKILEYLKRHAEKVS